MFDIILNLNSHINEFITTLGPYFYLLLFLIIFCETGFLFGIFLPGDSLLFSLGVAAAVTHIDVNAAVFTIIIAAILGDSCNYITGRILGEKLFNEDNKIFKKRYLDQTHLFFEKYGAKTLILARFVAFVRTFAPFVAGASRMNYFKFVILGAISACIWAISITYIAYLFSDNPFVKQNLSLIIMSAICLAIVYNVGKYIFKKLRKA